ncbi:MAG: BMP family ABC transporter substrate-binding protein [Oscillospiraceae bacterium]|nr:BMP family ABC transporter substrate-binding protein [Oscillospiraceae bacterium]
MKKILALLLVLAMTLSLAACGSKPAETAATTATEAPAATDAPAATEAPAAPAETEAPAAGVAKVALVTDVGTIDDESFNQACWQGVEAWCKRNNVEYTYYQPTEDSTDARVQSVAQAIAEGADTIVMPGYLFGATLTVVMEEYPDVHFIAVDVASGDLTVDYSTYYDPAANTACLTFSEEQAGYLAGYAAVKDGYTKLGFLGGMAVPAVIRYGFGFVQGADAAAAELGTPIEINYTYGGQFFGDANITAKMEGWYAAGTEVVFACGGGIYTSAVEAAKLHNGKVIGVDVDQSYIDECIVTSAMKQLQNVTETVLDALNNGDWATYGGKVSNFSLAEGEYVGLPTDADSWRLSTFTVDEYEALKAKLADGSVVVDNNSDDNVKPTVSDKTTVNYIG